MKVVGFIGVYDKSNMLLNIAKILTSFNNKVMLLDLTKKQKTKYIVPTISPTTKYITNFEDIDIAVGFESIQDLKRYLGEEEIPQYDILILDIDSSEALSSSLTLEIDYKYFVTAFDLYSLKLGLEIFQGTLEKIEVTKVLFSRYMIKEEDDYLNYLSESYNIKWKESKIYFPFESGDLSVDMENDRLSKIKLKKYTPMYKDGISYICQEILEEKNDSKIKRNIKALEKGE